MRDKVRVYTHLGLGDMRAVYETFDAGALADKALAVVDKGYDALKVVIRGQHMRNALSLHPPFSATWRVPETARCLSFKPTFNDSAIRSRVDRPQGRLLAYTDGTAAGDARMDAAEMRVVVSGAECVTLVGLAHRLDSCHLVLLEPRWE